MSLEDPGGPGRVPGLSRTRAQPPRVRWGVQGPGVCGWPAAPPSVLGKKGARQSSLAGSTSQGSPVIPPSADKSLRSRVRGVTERPLAAHAASPAPRPPLGESLPSGPAAMGPVNTETGEGRKSNCSGSFLCPKVSMSCLGRRRTPPRPQERRVGRGSCTPHARRPQGPVTGRRKGAAGRQLALVCRWVWGRRQPPNDLCAPDERGAPSSGACGEQRQRLWLGGQQLCQLDETHPPPLPKSGLDASPGSTADPSQSPPPQPSPSFSLSSPFNF